LEAPEIYNVILKCWKELQVICPNFSLKDATSKNVYGKFLKGIVLPPRIQSSILFTDVAEIFKSTLNDFLTPEGRILNWKIVHGILPVKTFLYVKHIVVNDKCIICGKVESLEHQLLECKIAKVVWSKIALLVKGMWNCTLYRTVGPIF